MNKQTMKTLNKLSFGISVFSLVAALTCGVLRRTGFVEFPAVVTGWIIPVFTAAAVGYLTNWLAIQLLFRPYEPVKWLGGLQGMIPRNKERIAKTLSEEIPKNLIPADKIISMLRQSAKNDLLGNDLPDRLRAMITEEIADEQHRIKLTQRIKDVLNTSSSTGVEFGLSPKNVRDFYHDCGSEFMEQKKIYSKAVTKIQDELKDQIPGLISEIRANISNSIDNELLKVFYKMLPKADGMWKTIGENIQEKISGKDAKRLIGSKLIEFKSRVDQYIDSQELETDIEKLKRNPKTDDMLKDMSEFLAEKLLEFLKEEFVWYFIREKGLFRIRAFADLLIIKYKNEILDWLYLKLQEQICNSINNMEPKKVHKLVDDVSGNELGMIQLLGFVLGGLAGFLLIFAQ